jgi:hypothetical protein
MPFTTPIWISVPVLEGGFFETVEPLNYYSLARQKNYVVPSGYSTDLASVPRLPVVFWWVGRRGDAAAIIHDWLYEMGIKFKQIKTRLEADDLYLEVLLDSRVPWATAYAMYAGVRAFGEGHFNI